MKSVSKNLLIEIKTLLNKGVIKEAQPSQVQVISSIFLRKKKSGSYRMILNLKRLNKCIEYKHFKMESLSFAVQLMRKNVTWPQLTSPMLTTQCQWHLSTENTCGSCAVANYFSILVCPMACPQHLDILPRFLRHCMVHNVVKAI